MAKTTTYTVPEVPGSSRTSHRPYTHAVVGRRNLARERQQAADPATHNDLNNWQFYQKVLRVGLGGVWSERHGYTVDQSMLDNAKRATEGCETVNDYVAKQIEWRLARINEVGTGPAGELQVLQWSMGVENARKGITATRREWYVNLAVVACVEA